MASIYSWESFIRIHGGYAGARDVFEKVMDDLLRAENPDKEVHIVKASRGDGGIDVYVHQEDGIDIYQCKFFMGTLDSSRWSQIKESFNKAMEPKGVTILRWCLCMPREMQKEDIEKWDAYKDEKEKKFSGVKLRYIDGNEIISRIEECDRVNDTALIDKYFHGNRMKHFTNKDLIIPFTMSKANGAQGGTYVPRDDLLSKIEESFKSDRIVFLSGMGGCGKSELARAYGYKHRDDYEEIFWLTCDDGVTSDLMGLMEKADLLSMIEKSDIKEFSDKVLIIVDNCNNEDERFLFELERNTGKAHILISTRLNFIADFEAIIPMKSSEPEKFAFRVFKKNYCKRLRRRNVKEIKDDEIEHIYKICENVQYNTMMVSLLAIKLRDDERLSVSDCVQKIKNGVRTIKGDVKYSKDLKSSSKEMRDILSVLFSDILHYKFSKEQRAVLTVLCLTPAVWYEIDYICELLDGIVEGTSHKGAAEELLDFGWLQGNGDRMTINPLIAEVISDKPIVIMEPTFFENLLENYLGLPDEYLRKEGSLIKKVLKLACKTSPDIHVVVMLLINHGGYKKLFKEHHPDVQAAYFLYTNYYEKRLFEYCDLGKNEARLLVEVPCNECEQEKVVFAGCSGLRGELHIPEKVTSIGEYAVYDCGGLSGELHIPEKVTSIGDCAFWGCSGLSGELHIPESVTSIGDCAFWGCSGLRGELHIPNSVTSIGDCAFWGCSGLRGELHIPESVTSIGDSAFYGCSGLSVNTNILGRDGNAFHGFIDLSGELHIPESVTSIGDSAFYGCSSLSGELHISEGVTSIGDSAFYGCSGLSGELHIPKSLTNIGVRAFERCTKIERVVFYNLNTKIENFLSPYSSTVIVGYRHSTAEAYAQENGLVFEEIEEEG